MEPLAFYAAIENTHYLQNREAFIRETTKKYLIDRDKVEKKIIANTHKLKDEIKRLGDYQTMRSEEYYATIIDDCRRWKQKTAND